MHILGLQPVEWALVALVTALIFVIGRLPERGDKAEGAARGAR